jgi:D-alanyl-lipoteichoic acid acyltransferase DltB (MBOAT superfamily)
MLFNSLEFIAFFIFVAFGYFALPHRFRWILLLLASYFFYACWKPAYLVLILSSTLVTYGTGLMMGRLGERQKRRKYVAISLIVNLGLIFTFKYFNFFSHSITALLELTGAPYRIVTLDVLLPVGISFYTFQALSYTVDVYRGERAPERHLGVFALYVAFFPQLVAGPIERSTRLLPQFFEKMRFDYARVTEGLSLMLFGFFKKLVIADRLAIYVNEVFNHPGSYNGLPVVAATYFFAFQIYCDFSGYSDIAIGGARVFGYNLMQNFNRPYAATSVSDFWRRWHISLSTWFKDYLYIPLGGNRCAKSRWLVNLLIVFLVSGLWHGANWTFVLWGALHGGYLAVGVLSSPVREKIAASLRLGKVPLLRDTLRRLVVFHLVVFAWIFFRANDIQDVAVIIGKLGIDSLDLSEMSLKVFGAYELRIGLLAILSMEILQYCKTRDHSDGLFMESAAFIKWPVHIALMVAIVLFGKFDIVEFIYFQF